MSVLQKEILLIGARGRRRCQALFDSGASFSIVRRDIAEALQPLSPLPDVEDWVFETARVGEPIAATHFAGLKFRFDDSEAFFSDMFIVFDECSEEVIIGAKTLQSCRIVLDFETEEIRYRKTAEKLRVV
ncbi:MAG TPA: retropepsin-like aspartic protease [Spirochaetia bacterium]